jgi:hypothetical protein
MSRLAHFLGSRLTDGGKAVSLVLATLYPLRSFLMLISVKRLSQPQGYSAVGRFR